MANNIVIRTAKNDYVCDRCGHKIPAGSEYLDKVILNTGKIVRHERYHDECPCDKVTDLFKVIKDAGYNLPCADSDGNKWHAKGITQDMVCITSWDRLEISTVSTDRFLKEYHW